MKKLYKSSLLILFILFAQSLFAQDYKMKDKELNHKNELYYIEPSDDWKNVPDLQVFEILGKVHNLKNKPQYTLREVINEGNVKVSRYSQSYNGFPLIGSDLIIRRVGGTEIRSIIGVPREVVPGLNKLPEDSVLVQTAKRFLGDKQFLDEDSTMIKFKLNIGQNPEDLKPTVRLVYYPLNNNFDGEWVSCAEIELETTDPAEYKVYVNLLNLKPLGELSNMHPSTGKGTGLFSGVQSLNTKTVTIGGVKQYQLEDTINKITTFNVENRVNGPVQFFDPNNDFDSLNQKAAVEAHYNVLKVYEYFKLKHGWTSYDNKGSDISNWVHFKVNEANAFWSNKNKAMMFGDGNATSHPWVSLDICGHEFSHAIISRTAGLLYRGESGALNEGWADIFGASVEFYVRGASGNWGLFEELQKPASGNTNERLMSDPKNCKCPWPLPDTYKGVNWMPPDTSYDFGGVHFNSQVAAYWYYLLTVGGKGTNDKDDEYDVTGITMAKSQVIAFKSLRLYIGQSTDYIGARKATLLYAEDKYGKKSNEYQQVCNAWFAVNVGEKCCGDTLKLKFDVTDATCPYKKDGEIDLTVTYDGKVKDKDLTYKWYKGDTTSAVLATSQDLTGRDTGTYTVIVKDTAAKCETVEKTKVKSPEDVEVTIGGGGTYFRPCDRRPEISLIASASGGTPPYEYNWGQERKKVIASEGAVGASGYHTAIVTDDNKCVGIRSVYAFFIPVVCSYDPNDIIGPPSYGEEKFVARSATLPYKIRFENDPDFATAPASKVTVDLPLDDNFDYNSFRLSSFGFNNFIFQIPAKTSSYYSRLDLRDSMGIYVDVTAGVNKTAKKAFWIFESIDPKTGLPPTDGSKGFLPVNDTAIHNGEGFVDFTIKAKTTTVTGDSLRAKAEIVFDQNPSIFTPRVHNIIDAVEPSSWMDSIAYVQDSLEFTLNFNGKDDKGGSGVGTYDLYVSENKGAYTIYAQNLEDSSIRFKGNQGATYDFYTLAADNVQNKEAAKKKPDLSVIITPRDFLVPLDSGLQMCAGDTMNVKWKNSGLASFNLQYTADSGKSYKTFAPNVSAADSLYAWILPDVFTSTVLMRIRATSTTTNASLDSTRTFSLSASPSVKLGNDTFYCQGTTLNLTLDAGSGNTSYLWDNNSTSQTRSISTKGTYKVQVTNGLGCNASDQIVVSEKVNPTLSAKSVSQISCFGKSDGAIDITIAGGQNPYTYLWSDSSVKEDVKDLSKGRYSVVVTDSLGCRTSDSFDVTEPSQILLTKQISNVKCKNGSDGSIDLTVTGGNSPFNYIWSNYATSQDLTSLSAGTYSVIVTDVKYCQVVDTVVISEPTLLVASHTSQNVKCKSGTDGSINLSVSGGVTPYTFVWSNSATTEDISGLKAGRYTVIITDKNNCVVRDTVDITEPTLLAATHTSQNVKCKNGNDGSIDLTVTGGTSSYLYLWNNGATTQDISGLKVGKYTVRITDGNNCIVRDTVDITEPTLLTVSHTSQNVKCKNGNDGSIDITVNGGTTTYSYLWSNGVTSQDLSSIAAGTYNVRITDANSCIVRDTVVISEPTLLVASHTFQNVKCKNGSDGSIDLTIAGGVTPYVYSWSNGSTSQDLSSLKAGRYTVVITDKNNCIVRDTIDITEPTLLVAAHTSQAVKCKNGSDGSIDLTITGGTTPYVYLWSNSATTQDLSGLTVGKYTVRITDGNNCIVRDTVDITEPTLLTVSHTSQNVKCKNGNDGSIDITVNGGTTSYSYVWSNGSTTQDLNALTAGTYSVRITDANSCIVRDTVVITEPTLLVASHTSQNVKCKNGNDGSVNLSVSGGVTPYTFVWSNSATTEDISGLVAGRYTVIITDKNNCIVRDTIDITEPTLMVAAHTSQNVKCKNGNDGSIDLTITGGTTPYVYLWSNSATTQDLSSLTVGKYTVRITDGNNCIVRDTVDITEPTLLTVSHTSQNVKCKNGNDGSIDITVNGGTTNYSYVWSNGSTTQDLNALTAGTYSVRITDANSCIVRDTVVIAEPTLLVISDTFENVKCKNGNDGSVNLSVSGGVTPYTFVWSNSASTEDLTSLTAGTYTVLVTDVNNCTVRDTVVITEPTILSSNVTISNVLCHNGGDGSATVVINGGTLPYSYSWSSGETVNSINNKTTGTYILTTKDTNLCVIIDTIFIDQPKDPLSLVSAIEDVKCFNGSDGSVKITTAGGTLPYQFLWSNGETSQDINGKIEGTYTLRILDLNNCELLDTFVIGQPLAPLAGVFSPSDVKCFGGNDGSVNLNVTGGTTPYSYKWSNSELSKDISSLITGWYKVVATDSNGCILEDSSFVGQPSAPLNSVLSETSVNCFGGNDGMVNNVVSGGTAPYNFSWSNGATSRDLTGLNEGKYVVTITDANLCNRKDSIVVSEPAAPLSVTFAVNDVICFGGNTGGITTTVSGGSPTYTFDWSNGQSSQNLVSLSSGWFKVTITDLRSCVLVDSVFVDEPSALELLSEATSATEGDANGTAWTTATGATPPYSYLWNDVNNQAVDTARSLTIGTYIVTVTDAQGCTRNDTVSVDPAPPKSEIKMFPNPNQGRVTIVNLASLGLDEPITIEFIDRIGKLVKTYEVVGKDQIEIVLSEEVVGGNYFVRIFNRRGIEVKNFSLIR